MFYYKILTLNNNLLGYGTSHNLVYYNKTSGLLLGCTEDHAQYIQLGGKLYRIPWLLKEAEVNKGKYPEVIAFIVSQEEYETYMKEQNKKVILE